MKISEKRKAAEILGRMGVSNMIDDYVQAYLKSPSLKNAAALAGNLKAMADSCTFDIYWEEKMLHGLYQAEYDLSQVISTKG